MDLKNTLFAPSSLALSAAKQAYQQATTLGKHVLQAPIQVAKDQVIPLGREILSFEKSIFLKGQAYAKQVVKKTGTWLPLPMVRTKIAQLGSGVTEKIIDLHRIKNLPEGGLYRTEWTAGISVQAGLRLDAKMTQELSVRLQNQVYTLSLGADFLRRAGVSQSVFSSLKLDGFVGMDQLGKIELKFKKEEKQSMLTLIQNLAGMLTRNALHMDPESDQEKENEKIFLSHVRQIEIGNAFHTQGSEKAELVKEIGQKYGVICNVYYSFRLEIKDGEPTGKVVRRTRISMEKQNNLSFLPATAAEKSGYSVATNAASLGLADNLTYTQDTKIDLSAVYVKGSGVFAFIPLLKEALTNPGESENGKLSLLHYDAVAGNSKGEEIKAEIPKEVTFLELGSFLAKAAATGEVKGADPNVVNVQEIQRTPIRGQGVLFAVNLPVVAKQKPLELQRFDLYIAPEK